MLREIDIASGNGDYRIPLGQPTRVFRIRRRFTSGLVRLISLCVSSALVVGSAPGLLNRLNGLVPDLSHALPQHMAPVVFVGGFSVGLLWMITTLKGLLARRAAFALYRNSLVRFTSKKWQLYKLNDVVNVQSDSGAPLVLTLSNGVALEVPKSTEDIDELAAAMTTAIDTDHLSESISSFSEDELIDFGAFSADRRMIYGKHEELRWDNVAVAELVSDTRLTIYRCEPGGGATPVIHAALDEFCNEDIFAEMLTRLSSAEMRAISRADAVFETPGYDAVSIRAAIREAVLS